jgi:hypothetical protein
MVLIGFSAAYEPCPPHAHHKNDVAEQHIWMTSENDRAKMIDSQLPFRLSEAVNAAIHLYQRLPNEG